METLRGTDPKSKKSRIHLPDVTAFLAVLQQ